MVAMKKTFLQLMLKMTKFCIEHGAEKLTSDEADDFIFDRLEKYPNSHHESRHTSTLCSLNN